MKCPNPTCKETIENGMLFCPKCGASTPDLQQEAIEKSYGGRPEQILDNIRLEIGRNTLATGTHGMLPLRFVNVQNQQPITRLKLTLQCSACGDDLEIRIDRQVRILPNQTIIINDCEFDIKCNEGFYNLKIQGELLVNSITPVAFHASERVYIRDSQVAKTGGINIRVREGGALAAGSLPSGSDVDIEVADGGAVALGDILDKNTTSGRQVEWVALNLEFAPDMTRLLESFLESQESISTENLPQEQSQLDSTALWRLHCREGSDYLVRIFTGKRFSLGRDPRLVDIVTTFLPATEENIKKSRAISGKQCNLSLTKTKVFVTDCNSKNGIRIQGKEISGEYELTNGCRLLLANIFRFDFREFRELSTIKEITEIRKDARDFNDFATRIGDLEIDVLRHDVPLDSCSLTRCDEFRDQLQYLFLRRFVWIGSSAACGLFLEHPSVAKKHARLMLMENGYFLEALDSRRETWLGDSRLYPGRPSPLPSNREVQIRFGELVVTFQATVV